jgi:hypothetical protein
VSVSSGTGGDTATGGSGSGGAVSSGGSTGTGGAAAGATGTGGAATGGNTGSGGSATAGSTGSGGSATGGNTGSGGSSSGTNLIANGDFSDGMTNWGVPNGSPTNAGVNNGEYCLTLSNSSGTVILGWGGSSISASLAANVNYTLSFQISSSSALSDFEAHVGSAVPVGGNNNYPIDWQVNLSPAPGSSLTSYTEKFSVTSADPQAGLAFQVAASSGNPTVCVDNVSLTEN